MNAFNHLVSWTLLVTIVFICSPSNSRVFLLLFILCLMVHYRRIIYTKDILINSMYSQFYIIYLYIPRVVFLRHSYPHIHCHSIHNWFCSSCTSHLYTYTWFLSFVLLHIHPHPLTSICSCWNYSLWSDCKKKIGAI